MTDDTDKPAGELVPNDGLTDLQREGARMAAEGWRGVDIADHLQVAPETISRWRKLPAFNAAILKYHDHAAAATRARLVGLIEQGLDKLETLMDFPHDKRIQLRAAIALLELAGVQRVMRASARSNDDE